MVNMDIRKKPHTKSDSKSKMNCKKCENIAKGGDVDES
jgi:hypothetical protein